MAVRSTESEQLNRRAIFKLFLAEKTDPEPFYDALATRTIAAFPFDVAGARVLDLGCGGGYYTKALRSAGAIVASVDADLDEMGALNGARRGALAADGRRLPFDTASFDGVFCSNMLEHSADTDAIFDEIERVLRPRGWAWVSWTNWYSPWGGHEITPFHYLGPRSGLAVHRFFRGDPRKNVPGEGLFPVHIGRTLDAVRRRPGLRLLDAQPRYYPSQRWIVSVPGLREVLTWNCVLVLERTADA